MLRVNNINDAWIKRNIRPLYDNTQATPKSLYLDPAWDSSVDIVPGMCMMKTAGDNVTLINGVGVPYGLADIFDPRANIYAGTHYLRTLLDTFHGDLDLTLAAYNAGPGAVQKYNGVPPFRETKNYVKQVNKLAGDRSSPSPAAPGTRLYKVTEYVDGHAVVKITDQKPTSGMYEIIGAR